MIAQSDLIDAFGGKSSHSILGGSNKTDNECLILSAYFNVEYTKKEVTEPKWWQFWKKPTITYIEGCQRWERKSCMLYHWQVESMGELDWTRNPRFMTLLFVLGGGVQQICGVQLESMVSATPYIDTTNYGELR